MDSRRTQIGRLRRVALAALAEYDLPTGTLAFVNHGENTTFRHDSAAGRHLVRVHRPQRHGRDAAPEPPIRSELAWLRAIRSETDLVVPEPLATVGGHDTVAATAVGQTRIVSVLGWLPGRILEESARPVHLARLGDAMARLHRHADAWTPAADFTRIRWDHDAFFGDVMVYGGLGAAECWELLPDDLRYRFDAVSDRLTTVMAEDPDVGLIHADLHTGNAVFARGEVGLIDFDDCGTGPRLYDLAVAVWEKRDEPDYGAYRDALLTGYTAVREIDTAHLDDYIAARQVGFCLWYTGQAQLDPHFAGRLAVVHRWSSDMLDVLGY